jgi:hypothetical protein
MFHWVIGRALPPHQGIPLSCVLPVSDGKGIHCPFGHSVRESAVNPKPASPVGSGLTESCSKWLAEEFSLRDGF